MERLHVLVTTILVTFLVLTKSVSSDCPAGSPIFPEIPSDQYDTTYSRIDADGKRPLGFDRGLVPYGNPDKSNHCVRVTGVAGKHVEIAFETVPGMTLCVKVDAGQVSCAEQGRYLDCLKSTSDTMLIEFTCEKSQGCSESDVNFWYRITKGPPPEEDTEEMWCMEREVEFPESLATIPPGVIPPREKPTTPSSRASNTGVSMATAVFVMIVALFNH